MGISRRARFRARGIVWGALVTSAAAVHCGGASTSEPANATPKTPTFSETPFEAARTRCIEFSDTPSCRKALASPEAVGDQRVLLLTTMCVKNMDPVLCCKSYEELPYARTTKAPAGNNAQAIALATCARFCFRANGSAPRFCEPFEGGLGEVNRLRACEGNYRDDVVCAGVDPGARAEIRARLSRIEQEEKDRVARFQREQQERKERDLEAYRRVSVTRNSGNGTTPAPPPRQTPARPRQSCQYMWVTGGTGPSGFTKPERHFYDAPDCGGVCCEGQSYCCVDATGTRESCSVTNTKKAADPETHFCRDNGHMRDRRRDDYPVLPILPGER
ncbi:MAG: hypothetical protein U0183_24685 [Polyangiaceae bacterium]